MKFPYKSNSDPTYSNPQCILRENMQYEVTRIHDDMTAFRPNKPRKDSKYWDETEYLVWDLRNNCKAYKNN
jgi:hypothetical protein